MLGDGGFALWTSMKYSDQQIVAEHYEQGTPTGFAGIRERGMHILVLAQEWEGGPIHMFDKRAWSVQEVYSQWVAAQGATVENQAIPEQSLDAVMNRSQGGTSFPGRPGDRGGPQEPSGQGDGGQRDPNAGQGQGTRTQDGWPDDPNGGQQDQGNTGKGSKKGEKTKKDGKKGKNGYPDQDGKTGKGGYSDKKGSKGDGKGKDAGTKAADKGKQPDTGWGNCQGKGADTGKNLDPGWDAKTWKKDRGYADSWQDD